jgi:phosphatidylserine decarboxylase
VEFRSFSNAASAYSALVGWGASQRLPGPIRGPAYRAFARAVGVDLDEAELELREYPTLGDFFARRLRRDARRIDPAPEAIIAPCDGILAALGHATDGTLVQAKGKSYRLDQLVADDDLATQLRGGAYATVYLSPRDYHRVHSPVTGRVVGYDYVPGSLWPVNPRIANRRDNLLARNERVVIRIETARGPVAVVMVGAIGVGNIRLTHAAQDSVTWLRSKPGELRRVELDTPIERGDELGAFRLGSTVVMVFAPSVTRELEGEVGAPVRFGERLGRAA